MGRANGIIINIKTTKNSIKRNRNMIISVMKSRKDFIIIPAIIEKNTSPSRYSFLSGLKNVLVNNGIERSDAIYLLNPIKKLKIPPTTFLYQKITKYAG